MARVEPWFQLDDDSGWLDAQCQRPQEVAQVVGQGVQLQTNLVVAEAMAGQPAP